MFSVFVPSESSLKKAAVTDLAALPDTAVWIDLVKPTSAEDKAVLSPGIPNDIFQERRNR